jgi:transcriptional regulator with XRE-family HTH domain
MIGRLERGVVAPSFETISTLAAALRVTPAVLFGARSRNVDANRRAVLERIDNLLTPASEVELKQVARVLKALLGE